MPLELLLLASFFTSSPAAIGAIICLPLAHELGITLSSVPPAPRCPRLSSAQHRLAQHASKRSTQSHKVLLLQSPMESRNSPPLEIPPVAFSSAIKSPPKWTKGGSFQLVQLSLSTPAHPHVQTEMR